MSFEKNKYDALFISPHLDDAVLSAGGLIASLVSQKKKVLLVTIFTQGDNTIFSDDALSFLQSTHHTDALKLFEKRRQEDRKAASVLGIEHVHLQYTDALFRHDDLNLCLYPNFKALFQGKISEKDSLLNMNLSKELCHLIAKYGKSEGTQFFTCLGVGNHVDHVITHNIVKRNFPKTIFWQDVPYDWKYIEVLKRLTQVKKYSLKKKSVSISDFAKKKRAAVSCYHSQLAGLNQTGLNPQHLFQETFFQQT